MIFVCKEIKENKMDNKNETVIGNPGPPGISGDNKFDLDNLITKDDLDNLITKDELNDAIQKAKDEIIALIPPSPFNA